MLCAPTEGYCLSIVFTKCSARTMDAESSRDIWEVPIRGIFLNVTQCVQGSILREYIKADAAEDDHTWAPAEIASLVFFRSLVGHLLTGQVTWCCPLSD